MQLRGKREGIVGANGLGERWEARAPPTKVAGACVCVWGPGKGDGSQERTAYR